VTSAKWSDDKVVGVAKRDGVVVITPQMTRTLLPMPELIAATRRQFEIGQQTAPVRTVLDGGDLDWIAMPGLRSENGLLCKLVRVNRTDSGNEKARIAGVVLLLTSDGDLECVIDASEFTARRTAAAAAYATDLLAKTDAQTLALFGTGALAAPHIEAITTIRPISEIRIVGRSQDRTASFAEARRAEGYNAVACDAQTAVRGADIIVTVTNSERAVFDDADIDAPVHINAMGSYRPERREIPGDTVARAQIVVESIEATWHEAGDIVLAHSEGLIARGDIALELHNHEEISAIAPGGITLFKSVGHVCLDLAAAEVLSANLSVNS
jgi:ornithine cyclodeaminase/alanine dehydrogenase-like protein (mu-crystallin family)